MVYSSVLVTGANKGIELHLVKQFLQLENRVEKVIATYRDPNTCTDLNELAKLHSNLSLLQLEMKDYASYDSFAEKVAQIVGDKGLNLLINNAGIAFIMSLEQVTPEKMIENYEVNTIGPLMLSKVLLPLLRKSSNSGQRTVIVNISSSMGSITENSSGNFYSYRASKTALNQIGKSMSLDLKKDSISVLSLCPGWVRTSMGTSRARLSPEESSSQITSLLIDTTRDINGKFLKYNGNKVPW